MTEYTTVILHGGPRDGYRLDIPTGVTTVRMPKADDLSAMYRLDAAGVWTFDSLEQVNA